MKKAFTLAEIMIVLTIIGVLTMILLPIANHSRPDEAVMKFKKADTTLKNVIRELVNSDQYYADGDLGMRKMPDGTTRLIDGTHAGDKSYFCNTFADAVLTKSQNCSDLESRTTKGYFTTDTGNETNGSLPNSAAFRQAFDNNCKNHINDEVNAKIITTDGVTYTFLGSCEPFGEVASTSQGYDTRSYCGTTSVDSCRTFLYKNSMGFYGRYREACITIGDEIFGYGIRVDGRIITGAKAMEWLEKGFQKGKDDN